MLWSAYYLSTVMHILHAINCVTCNSFFLRVELYAERHTFTLRLWLRDKTPGLIQDAIRQSFESLFNPLTIGSEQLTKRFSKESFSVVDEAVKRSRRESFTCGRKSRREDRPGLNDALVFKQPFQPPLQALQILPTANPPVWDLVSRWVYIFYFNSNLLFRT